MRTAEKTRITVETIVKAPVEKVWDLWTSTEHIVRWNQASDDWHSPWAENELRPGGTFVVRMEAKDGSSGFDFQGVYDEVVPFERIAYTMADGRRVLVRFARAGAVTWLREDFEPEDSHTLEQQHEGWQSILDNFRQYAESC